jgi:uncharacterized membrane protein YdbT with pleckstrin-like domain
MTLSSISKIVLISSHGKKAILAQVVEFDTFTLLAHEVLGVGVVVVVFFSVAVAMWVVRGFFLWFQFRGGFGILRRLRDV